MMEKIRNMTTIKDRDKGLTAFLKDTDVGHLSEVESKQFRLIFQQFYTPNKGEDKFDDDAIQNVGITIDPQYRNKCFCIYLIGNPDTPILCGKKYLAGSKRNQNINIQQAARLAIKEQIEDFRNKKKLEVNEMCPACSKKLGSDAQVDHETTFQNLLNGFCLANKLDLSTIKTEYHQGKYHTGFKDSTISTKWFEYHKRNAKLRWLCKECNQRPKTVEQNWKRKNK